MRLNLKVNVCCQLRPPLPPPPPSVISPAFVRNDSSRKWLRSGRFAHQQESRQPYSSALSSLSAKRTSKDWQRRKSEPRLLRLLQGLFSHVGFWMWDWCWHLSGGGLQSVRKLGDNESVSVATRCSRSRMSSPSRTHCVLRNDDYDILIPLSVRS